jgi:O-antigen/teichoic acid export membrane protein
MTGNSVIAGVLVARFLGAESLGKLAVLNVAIVIAIQLGGFGVANTNSYFTAGDRENVVPAAINGTLFVLVSGIICAFVIWTASPIFLPGIETDLVAIGVLSIPCQLVTSIVNYLFLAQGQVKRFNILEFLNQSFVLINVVVVLLLFSGGLRMLVSLNTAASAGVSVLTLILLYRYLSQHFADFPRKADLSLLRKMLSYALKIHVLWVSTFFLYRFDLIIVNYFRGAAVATVYSVATQCTLFLLILPYAVANLLQNRVAARGDDNVEFTCRVARHTSLLMFGACVVSVPGIFLVKMIYGTGFDDLPIQFWILLPGVYFAAMQVVMSQYFVGTGLPLKLPVAWVITFVSSVILNILIVPIYGGRGAAVVSTACYFLIFVVIFIFFKGDTGKNLSDILIPRMNEIRELLRSATGYFVKQNAT